MTDTEISSSGKTQKLQLNPNEAFKSFIANIPYITFLGIHFDLRDNKLTAIMPFSDHLIGNPARPALHGGATASFLEVTALIGLIRKKGLPYLGSFSHIDESSHIVKDLPKTIDFTVDYLRPGLAKTSYAQAHISYSGRRYASVHVRAWQDDRDRLFAQANGHFLFPENRYAGTADSDSPDI